MAFNFSLAKEFTPISPMCKCRRIKSFRVFQRPPGRNLQRMPMVQDGSLDAPANLSVADSVGSHACGERSRVQAESVSFAHGHAKKAYRASWRGLAVVIKEPLSRSGQDVARFRSMILIDDQARSNVARSAPEVLGAFARVYATCTSSTTPFQIVERLQPFETAISSLSWIPRLQVARQVAEFGLRLKQAELVNCDWKPEQTALNAFGAFRIVDTKNFRSVSPSVANCSATYQCIRQGCNIWGPRPREGQRKPRILPEHTPRLHVQKRCARIAWSAGSAVVVSLSQPGLKPPHSRKYVAPPSPVCFTFWLLLCSGVFDGSPAALEPRKIPRP